jgi:hypothetical protein
MRSMASSSARMLLRERNEVPDECMRDRRLHVRIARPRARRSSIMRVVDGANSRLPEHLVVNIRMLVDFVETDPTSLLHDGI